MNRFRCCAVLAIAVCGGCGKETPPVDHEKENAAISLIEEHNGTYGRAHATPFAVDWISLGNDSNFSGENISDEVLAQILEGTPQLTDLRLWHVRIGDSSLGELGRLTPHLRVLKINEATVSDVGVSFLDDLSELETLWIFESQATPESGVKLQQKLSGLEDVKIENSGPTDPGLLKPTTP